MSLQKEIILGEINGKHAAIHAYDKIIWTIRTGYLTLFYSGWAIVLNAIVDKGGDFDEFTDVIIVMLAITFSLTAGAYIVDNNYLKRKFRVIYALNEILKGIVNCEVTDDIDNDVVCKFKEHIRVSGDADNSTYDKDGYKQALNAETSIYLISALSLLAALAYVYLG